MNLNDISTQLLYTTVPIYFTTKDGVFGSGTGFIFSIIEDETRSIPLLITNYHVLENAEEGIVEFHRDENGTPASDKSIRVRFDRNIINDNKLGDLDLIAVPLATSFNELQMKNTSVFFRSIDPNMVPSEEKINDLAAMEDITFIGYPSGLYDQKNKIPIIRKGITATPIWIDFEGEEEFLIDAGVFPGSSGSPVFIYNQASYPTKDRIVIGNRLMFVGVISKTLLNSSKENYLNLGVVINSKAIYREVTKFIGKLKNKNA